MRMLGEFVVSMGLVLGDSGAKVILAGCISCCDCVPHQ
jgi:hypothetical protein